MIVYILSWAERYEGILPGGIDAFATKEAAARYIDSHNAALSLKEKLTEWDSQHNRQTIDSLVAAWSNGLWYVYLTEHEVQE